MKLGQGEDTEKVFHKVSHIHTWKLLGTTTVWPVTSEQLHWSRTWSGKVLHWPVYYMQVHIPGAFLSNFVNTVFLQFPSRLPHKHVFCFSMVMQSCLCASQTTVFVFLAANNLKHVSPDELARLLIGMYCFLYIPIRQRHAQCLCSSMMNNDTWLSLCWTYPPMQLHLGHADSTVKLMC